MKSKKAQSAPKTTHISYNWLLGGAILPIFILVGASAAGAAAVPPVAAGPGDDLIINTGDTVTTPTGHAISATGGGTVTGTTIQAESTDATTAGAAVYASGSGSTVTLNAPGSTITGNYVGAWMDAGGAVNLGDGTTINMTGIESGSAGIVIRDSSPTMGSGITINMDGAPRSTGNAWFGVSAQGAGTNVSFDNLTVQGSEVSVGGMAADGATLNLSNSNLYINGSLPLSLNYWTIPIAPVGAQENGLVALSGSTINAVNTNLFVTSPNASAINILGGSFVHLDGVNVNQTQGDVALFLEDLSTGTVDNTILNVQSTGLASGVGVVRGSVLDGDSLTVNVQGGTNSQGVLVTRNGTLRSNNMAVSVQGTAAKGLWVRTDGEASLTGGTVTVDGSGASGLQLGGDSGASTINLTNVDVAALGTGSFGANVLNGTAATLNMSGGSITSTGTALNVAAGSSPALFNLSDGAVITGGNGLLLDVAGGATVLNANNGVVLNGDMQTAILNTTTANLSGNTVWTGAARNIGDLTISGDSVWKMTANSDVRVLSLDNSVVAFAAPGSTGYKTLTVRGDYTGSNGLVGLNTSLGDSSSPTDMLIVNGTTSGNSLLRITNTDGAGEPTTGDGIQVVHVDGASAGDFALSGRAAAGLYEYSLRRGAAGGNWYLNSLMLGPDGNIVPNIRPEVPLNTALIPLAREYGYSMVDTLHERVGETRLLPGAAPASPRDKRVSGAWARALGEQGSHNADSGFMNHGASYDYTMGGAQAGLDLYTRLDADGSLNRAGIYVGYGRTDADVDAVYSGNAGDFTLNAYSVGGYWTHLSSLTGSGWYTDAVVQGTAYEADSRSSLGEHDGTDGKGFVASLESGWSFDLGGNWAIEPQAQLAYQILDFDDTHDSYGRFGYNDDTSLRGRAGARVSKLWDTGSEGKPRTLSTWARGNVWHEFLGDSSVTASALNGGNPTRIKSTPDGTWGEIGLGVSGHVAENTSLFTTGGYEHSLDGNSREGFTGRVGVAYEW